MAAKLKQLQNLIYEIREQKVMLDSDLSALYGVELRSLNQPVKRNIGRFPLDFMFQLTNDEWDSLRSQIVISKNNRGGRRYAPFVFTEQGVSMLSSVINSERAIEVNINIMRAFVKLRHYVLSKSDTNEQIAELRKLLMVYIENTDYKLSKHDKAIEQIIIALNNLIEQPLKTKKIGFNTGN
jgi:phage regulator Rha-like protein